MSERTRIIVRRPPILLLYFMTSDHLEPQKSKGSLSLKDSQQSHFFLQLPQVPFSFSCFMSNSFYQVKPFSLFHPQLQNGTWFFFFSRVVVTSCQNIAHYLGDKMFQFYTRQVPKIPLNKRKLIPNLHWKPGQCAFMHIGIWPEFQSKVFFFFLQGLLLSKVAMFTHSCLTLLFYTELSVHFHLFWDSAKCIQFCITWICWNCSQEVA